MGKNDGVNSSVHAQINKVDKFIVAGREYVVVGDRHLKAGVRYEFTVDNVKGTATVTPVAEPPPKETP